MNSMELLLNIFWLFLALAGVALWWTRWLRAGNDPRQRRHVFRGAVALCCVLVLLFFAISLTDDLQQIAAVAEDFGSPGGPPQFLKTSSKGAEFGKQETPIAGILVSKLMWSAVMVIGRAFPFEEPAPQTASRQLVPSRAPPHLAALVLHIQAAYFSP